MACHRWPAPDHDPDGESAAELACQAQDYVSRLVRCQALATRSQRRPEAPARAPTEGGGRHLKMPAPGSGGDEAGCPLLLLPPELILQILSHLDPRLIVRVLPLVCRALRDIVTEKVTWRIRVQKRVNAGFPVVE
ncbi:hypothetical protein FKM82_017467, partial [Ascaphus truei]